MLWPDCDPLSQGVSLSSALVHLNNLDKRTAFLTRAELKNAKRVVIKLGRSGFILDTGLSLVNTSNHWLILYSDWSLQHGGDPGGRAGPGAGQTGSHSGADLRDSEQR